MNRLEVQQTAEQVINLEARIISWNGNVPAWIEELAQLHDTINTLLHQATDEHDTIGESFLKCLELITDQCRQRVIKRAYRFTLGPEPVYRDI